MPNDSLEKDLFIPVFIAKQPNMHVGGDMCYFSNSSFYLDSYYSTLLCRACSGTVNYCLPPLSVPHEPQEFTSLSARISCQNVDIAFRWSALGSSSVSWFPQYHSVHYFIFASVAVPCKWKSSNLDDTRYWW